MTHVPWPWTESLGGLKPDPIRRFRIERILFGMVRDRCRDLDLVEGQEVRCRVRTREEVSLELSDGRVSRLEVPYAWFVHVHPVEEHPSPAAN